MPEHVKSSEIAPKKVTSNVPPFSDCELNDRAQETSRQIAEVLNNNALTVILRYITQKNLIKLKNTQDILELGTICEQILATAENAGIKFKIPYIIEILKQAKTNLSELSEDITLQTPGNTNELIALHRNAERECIQTIESELSDELLNVPVRPCEDIDWNKIGHLVIRLKKLYDEIYRYSIQRISLSNMGRLDDDACQRIKSTTFEQLALLTRIDIGAENQKNILTAFMVIANSMPNSVSKRRIEWDDSGTSLICVEVEKWHKVANEEERLKRKTPPPQPANIKVFIDGERVKSNGVSRMIRPKGNGSITRSDRIRKASERPPSSFTVFLETLRNIWKKIFSGKN